MYTYYNLHIWDVEPQINDFILHCKARNIKHIIVPLVGDEHILEQTDSEMK